jgi:protease-4
LGYHPAKVDVLGIGPDAEPEAPYAIVGRVAVLNIEGTILPKCSGLEMYCGGFSLAEFRKNLSALANNAAVEAIILNINSGGGIATGVPEAADLISEVSKTKTVIAYVDELAASAAYWLASQAKGGIFLSKSAEAGSIGVYCELVDDSAAWAKAGLKLELFKAGAFKAAGISGKPLSDEERALFQANVNRIYLDFTGYVTAARPKVKSETMQGQCFFADECVNNGLADGIINSLDSLIAYLNGQAALTEK